ncbi:hypothetical protein PVAP13_8KG150700 [Panicum virgatum]|uniref:WRKY domain-containing protein n=1 Tax=Panicum virgatum TaxID=38727 RepID=A0A8T0PH93_PANVG|nr:hypothetical protein PVAP13_8KG150700 [Panicum virgatum]
MEVQMSSSSLGAMGSLLGKLCSLLVSPEDQLPEPLQLQKDKLKLLKQDLEEINKFLVNLSWMEAPNMMVRHWMNEVRDLSYDIEDYIDKMHSDPNTDEVSSSGVDELSSLVNKAKDAHERHNRYDLGRWASDPRVVVDGQGWIPRLNGEATELVGIGDSKAQLIKQLNIDVEQRIVVSIYGPVGVGKTTLAKEVYRQIGGQFQCRAFVRASKMPDTRRLLRSMIFQVQRHQRPPQGLTVQDLIDHLRKLLQQKRYLIVIDGLWETTSWDIVSSAFPEDTHCSRVLVTTDIQDVALECCDYQSDGIFTMEPLSRNDTRELLFNRAFGSNHECSEQLKEVSEEIIKKCRGFSLATLCIARVLASKPDNSELWHHIKESLSCDIRNNLTSEDMLRGIIHLSYNSLPHHLKTCLLYFHMFPEGYMFLKTDLLKQWTAEGFISAADGKATSKIAESYFDELVYRGFIQPNRINFSDEVMFYTVHSTIFEVIRCESMEGNFITVIDYSEISTKLSAKVRRLSIRFSNAKYATKPEGITLAPVRSLFFYGLVECLPSITEFESLRVLNLEVWGAHGDELDLSGIDRLFQLRYLWVSTNVTVKLPTMMKALQYLETLEIYAKVTTVPTDIVNLATLQHLCLYGDINLPDGIAYLRSLRTLQSFDLSSNSEDNVRSLGELKNLHQLHLTCSGAPSDRLKRKLMALVSSLGKLGNLNSLVLAPGASCTSIYSDCSNSVSCVPVSLQILEMLPPICIFSRLPEWKPTRESIVFKSATFPVLKYFKFRCGVLHLAFQAKAMPNLQKLKLEFNAHRGDQYSGMLAGIEHLLNLREVAARIGAGAGVEESDRMAAESAFIDTISKNSGLPMINMQWVDSFDEEISQFSDLQASTSHLDGIVIDDPGKTLDVFPEASPYLKQNPTATVDIIDLEADFSLRTTAGVGEEWISFHMPTAAVSEELSTAFQLISPYDCYSWRKYGLKKKVKAGVSENQQSYFKCGFPDCPVKKKVEISLDGQTTEIMYKGSHNHAKPQNTRRNSSAAAQLLQDSGAEASDHTFAGLSGVTVAGLENPSASVGNVVGMRSPHSSGLDEHEKDSKRLRKNSDGEGISLAGRRTVLEPRVVVQATSDVDIIDDGFRWRMYGRKKLQRNPNPRSYFRCAMAGCPMRKRVERASHDLRVVVTTYTGKHNHDAPARGPSSLDLPPPAVANQSSGGAGQQQYAHGFSSGGSVGVSSASAQGADGGSFEVSTPDAVELDRANTTNWGQGGAQNEDMFFPGRVHSL